MENQHALRESVRNLNEVAGEVAQLDFSAKWLEDGLQRLVLFLQQNVSRDEGTCLTNEVRHFMLDRLSTCRYHSLV